jgi:ABC-type transporter Mla MlaB component
VIISSSGWDSGLRRDPPGELIGAATDEIVVFDTSISVVAESRTSHAQIRAPLRRSDLPGLYARICAQLAEARGGTLVCDVASIPVDAVAVEALARLKLGARRHGCRVVIANAPGALGDLAALFGLDELLAAA